MTTLHAVLDAITNCVEDAVEADFDFEQDDIVLEFLAGARTPFSLLSDGQRSVAATVGDIALRCAIINPHLKGDARLETPGVVLIDELDQHLHPRWQRQAIADLQDTFPRLQFVATVDGESGAQLGVGPDAGSLVLFRRPTRLEEGLAEGESGSCYSAPGAHESGASRGSLAEIAGKVLASVDAAHRERAMGGGAWRAAGVGPQLVRGVPETHLDPLVRRHEV